MSLSRPSALPLRLAVVVVSAAVAGLVVPATAPAAPADPPTGPHGEEYAENFELVGHDPLFARGMNAAPAKHGDYVYIGNRTDGQDHHPNPGILVVDVSDPTDPTVVSEIGPPDAALPGETSRELRVWPQQDLLVVMNFMCSPAIHDCTRPAPPDRYTFFDISGDNAAEPELVAEHFPDMMPHEMFLWVDPAQPDERALLFSSTVTASTSAPSMVVTDISNYADGEFPEYEWVADFPRQRLPDGSFEDRRLHSMTVSNDGTEAYLAFLGAGYLTLDVSEVTAGVPDPEMRLLTPPENRVHWSNPGAHSSHRIFGTDTVLVTDEVYGDSIGGAHGCPWGWVRTIDVRDHEHPEVIGEYRVEENEEAYCDTPEGSDPANTTFTSYSAHNPTMTRHHAFITWHSAGLEAVWLPNPREPKRAGKYVPEPLDEVATEDPALSEGLNKVVMWSFPIISDGLIYVVDLRNGLYILEYTGRGRGQVDKIEFLEGNSNLGDALRLEPVRDVPRSPRARG